MATREECLQNAADKFAVAVLRIARERFLKDGTYGAKP